MNSTLKTIFTICLLCAFSIAQAEIKIEQTVQSEHRSKDDEGKTVIEYKAIDKLLPGDTLLYKVVATNTGSEPAENVEINNNFSEHVIYIMGSAQSSAQGKNTTVTFSADDGTTYAPAGEVVVTKGGEEQVATAEDFTNIKWVLNFELPPGKSTTVSFKAKVK